MFSSIVEDQIIRQSVLEIYIATVDERPAHPPLPHYGNCHYGTSHDGIISLCTRTFLVYQYCLKMWYLRSLDHASVI